MTLANTDSSQFFGMDLAQWPRQWQAAGALLLDEELGKGDSAHEKAPRH